MEITVIPYRGKHEKIISSEPTFVELQEHSLDYKINYTYEAKYKDEDLAMELAVEELISDVGSVVKDKITAMSFVTDNLDDEFLYQVQVFHTGYVSFRCKEEQEAQKLFRKIYNWRHNIKEGNNDNKQNTIHTNC